MLMTKKTCDHPQFVLLFQHKWEDEKQDWKNNISGISVDSLKPY